jgi:paraquat-inducible protein B
VSEEAPPRSARARRRWWLDPLWLVPLAAAASVGWVVAGRLGDEGPTIEITFARADGIAAGKSELRFRGVTLGAVRRVRLHDDLKHVVVEVALERSAEALARDGAKFWVVRPRLSAGGVRGLSTVVSGSYVAALPGHGAERLSFKGLSDPPAIVADQKGLELVVTSERKLALTPGAPVFYRGVKVGAAAETELSKDARRVRTRVTIEAPYRGLVRMNSRFWDAGGIKFDFGLLSGAHISAKSLSTLIEGGLAFATPDEPGAPAPEGQEFPLNDKADDAWLKWSPALKVGPQAPGAEDDE